MHRRALVRFLASVTACVGLGLGTAGLIAADNPATQSGIFPPTSHPYGQSYAEWSVAYWKWALSQPVTGHPFVDSPDFDVASGQDGKVWFLAGVLDSSQALTITHRSCTIPSKKALFVSMVNSEWSSLEGYPTEEEQRAAAVDLADHIVGMTCTLDGTPVDQIFKYRFLSPQFTFTAPTPWIFGATGGTGTAVGDGYYVFLKPLHVGHHTLRFTGGFHYSVAEGDAFDFDAALDMTYDLDVVPN
jgi:hypothetical protein